jgi:asparagine synthase (glutamine-hydrolysing)
MLPNLYDEPCADSSQIPTYLISKLAKKNVTVCLSGDAGYELFGGYNRYIWAQKFLKIPFPLRRLSSGIINSFSPDEWDNLYKVSEYFVPKKLRFTAPGNKIHKLAGILSMNSIADIYTQLVSISPQSENLLISDNISSYFIEKWNTIPDNFSPQNKMMLIDSLTYLPDDILCKVDRAAMGVSLETRVPFLDHRVVDFAWKIPIKFKIRDGQNKWILRQVLYKYLPKELIERPKMGFGVPLDSWLRGPLREWAEELLNESKIEKDGFLNQKRIRQIWEEHLSGKKNWQHQLWNILMFQSWLHAN